MQPITNSQNITALPAPQKPYAPAAGHDVAKVKPAPKGITRPLWEARRKHHQIVMWSCTGLGKHFVPKRGIVSVQVDGLENLQDFQPGEAATLMASHALEDHDTILWGSHVLPALANPHTGEYRVVRAIMRDLGGVAGLGESALFTCLTVNRLITQVPTPYGKNMSAKERAKKREKTFEKILPKAVRRLVGEGDVQIIADQGNVRGPGPVAVQGVGARKAFAEDKKQGKPVKIIPLGITYEPNGLTGLDAFVHFGVPVVVAEKDYTDGELARATECELLKQHTIAASTLAGIYIFKQRRAGREPRLLEAEFKTLVRTFVDEVRTYQDVNLDNRLLNPETREAALQASFEDALARQFIKPWGAVDKVGAEADLSLPPRQREDARTSNVVLQDPWRFNGNRGKQLFDESPALSAAFDKACDAAAAHAEALIRENPSLIVPVEPAALANG